MPEGPVIEFVAIILQQHIQATYQSHRVGVASVLLIESLNNPTVLKLCLQSLEVVEAEVLRKST